MSEEEFWALIAACAPANGDHGRWADVLTRALVELGEEPTLGFHRHLDEVRSGIDTWIMWAIAWRILGRCDDNEYFAFLHWLVAQGPEVVRAVRARPDAVAGIDEVRRRSFDRGDLGFDLLAYVAPRAYEQLTGEPDGLYDELEARGVDVAFGPEPGGPNVDPTSVARYAPRVAAMFPLR